LILGPIDSQKGRQAYKRLRLREEGRGEVIGGGHTSPSLKTKRVGVGGIWGAGVRAPKEENHRRVKGERGRKIENKERKYNAISGVIISGGGKKKDKVKD